MGHKTLPKLKKAAQRTRHEIEILSRLVKELEARREQLEQAILDFDEA